MSFENLLTKISDEVGRSIVILEKCFKIFNAEHLQELLHEGVLETLDFFQLVFVKLGPDLDSIMESDGGIGLGGDEANPVDFFSTVFRLSQEIVDQPFVDVLVLSLSVVNLENQASPRSVVLVFPGGLDAISEKINRIDLPLFAINFIAKLEQSYVGQMLRPP